MSDADGLAAALGLLAFLAVLVAWDFMTDTLGSVMGGVQVPDAITTLVFLGACALAIIIYMQNSTTR